MPDLDNTPIKDLSDEDLRHMISHADEPRDAEIARRILVLRHFGRL